MYRRYRARKRFWPQRAMPKKLGWPTYCIHLCKPLFSLRSFYIFAILLMVLASHYVTFVNISEKSTAQHGPIIRFLLFARLQQKPSVFFHITLKRFLFFISQALLKTFFTTQAFLAWFAVSISDRCGLLLIGKDDKASEYVSFLLQDKFTL